MQHRNLDWIVAAFWIGVVVLAALVLAVLALIGWAISQVIRFFVP